PSVQPGGRPFPRAGARRTDRLARRALDARPPNGEEHEHAPLAWAALADRPRRLAVLPPRAGAGGGTRADAVPGALRARPAAVWRAARQCRRGAGPTSRTP